MYTFYWPWLALLLPLPLLARYVLPSIKDAQTTPKLRFPELFRLQTAFKSSSHSGKKTGWWNLLLLWLIWVALLLAVMRPQKVDQYTSVRNRGYDLMLAVDISGSMRALDFSTQYKAISRLDVTKQVVSKFVKERQGDRIGLILFGDHAYLHIPLTLDTLSVSQMLNKVVSGMAGPSTAIGDAIGLAVRNLRERPEGSRVIILLTDGEDTSSTLPPLEAARLAKQYGIRIYTIGVGRDGPVPYPDDLGGVIMAQIPIDENLLKQIAKITDGKYFRATNAQSLNQIYSHINKLEKSEAEVREYLIREPLYPYPLSLAALLFLIICLTPIFRRMSNGRQSLQL